MKRRIFGLGMPAVLLAFGLVLSGCPTDGGSDDDIPATAVTIDQGAAANAVAGSTLALTATVTPDSSTDQVTWSSGNEDIATVANNGIVTGITAGNAVITATAGGQTDTISVTVVANAVPATGVTITQGAAATVPAGSTLALTATVAPDGSTDQVTWSSGNTAVADVGETSGIVTGKTAGNAVITAKAGGQTATISITVSGGGNDLTGTWTAGSGRVIVFSGTAFTYTVNGTATYSGTFSVSGSTITFSTAAGQASGGFQLSGNTFTLSNHTWDSSVNGTYTKSGNSGNGNGNENTGGQSITVSSRSQLDTAFTSVKNDTAHTNFTILLAAGFSSSRIESIGRSGITLTIKSDSAAERVITFSGESAIDIESGVSLILDAGVTLSKGTVYVRSGGSLTMRDGAKIQDNTKSSSSSDVYGGGVYVDGGTFTMEGGTISGNSVSASSRSSAYYSSANNSYGGGVYIADGTFAMKGGTISGNSASSSGASSGGSTTSSVAYGGGVYVAAGTFTMSGGTINGNTASGSYSGSSSYGGGVSVAAGASFTMSGGTIDGNTASGSVSTSFYGGGVYISGGTNSGTFTMTGGTISNNTAHEGGGVYNGGAFTMNSGTISGNSASGSNSGSGGGVYTGTNMGGTFTMYGGTIGGNTASIFGGGVYASGSFAMEDGTISGNSATRGGGVYVYGTGTSFTKAAGIIYGSNTTDASLRNRATDGGAGNAVYVVSGSRSSRRNTTAGTDVFLDSGISGASGGWE